MVQFDTQIISLFNCHSLHLVLEKSAVSVLSNTDDKQHEFNCHPLRLVFEKSAVSVSSNMNKKQSEIKQRSLFLF